ncbi:uncharacterized protein LOC132938884 [Metopolophium dirhodum]|uniref:uncharacterized protein LOC132938884 n=1 Tax=Metopolophium dirhodum TaxID=44670 RepID=UPI0029904ECE|nr:uncharacterized protein LOC132938884 [Metopolophium dirhodum]
MIGVVHQHHACQGYKEVHCGLRTQTPWKSLYISHQPDYPNQKPWKEPMFVNRNGDIPYEYSTIPTWQNTVGNILIPLCNYIHSHEENKKEDNKGPKYILNDLLSTCETLNKYQENNMTDNKDYQHIIDHFYEPQEPDPFCYKYSEEK